MDKIKVSKEIGKALDLVIKSSGKKSALDAHTSMGCWTIKEYIPLNKLSNWEMAEILIYGYEVEESPEEIVEKVFNNLPDSEKDIYYKSGILFALNAYGIKIKGINS